MDRRAGEFFCLSPLSRRRVIEISELVGPFVVARALRGTAPGTTRTRRTRRDCLATTSPGPIPSLPRKASRLLLRPHSRSTAFESRGRLSPRTGYQPAAADLPRLVMDFSRPVTSLGGVTRLTSRRVSGLPPEHSLPPSCLRKVGFRGAERRSSPLPTGETLFAVRHRLQSESLASPSLFGPFMVELFTAGGFVPGPRPRSRDRFRLSPGRKLPTRAELDGHRSPGPSDGIRGRAAHPL